ncbi:succinate dehydrogenase, hydrophobic membrane anchor protein [Novosphingobium sp. PC22D]|uniref:succinate dehydrogenase, hydrophobic membrane anchor protein n=1 Tax=Novosphingobium sp. PC22D TaxID=1962403 RepID=UPI000BF11654|nr:succinate dehydrogenase, hydrophobic membrane anchor protein [Novosphingobium sp. PC22D]PEQ11784.1 succinate dehydrogenase, hydrophobic membrane anchor protein [Novosphingobium sp. PC22D]
MGNGTSIGRVRGLGSAKSGSHHWLLQRFTAIGNLLLGLWIAVSILLLPNLSYSTVVEWVSAPVPATAMALLIISTIWHARLGLQVLFEDYVHENGSKFAVLTLLNLAAFAGAAFGLFCVIRLALGGAA